MKRKKHIGNSLVRLLICLLVTLGTLGIFVNAANEPVKRKKSYDIAVVFDNSGSMYDDESWCRAKYAMEIFASMLDYDSGDKLRIYPMWEVTTDGSTPIPGANEGARESSAPVIVSNKKDIDKISNMYTIHAYGTPFTPVTTAYDYLCSSSASEKWMIVLSDGAFDGGEGDADQLKQRFLDMTDNSDISIQYLRFTELANGEKQLTSDEEGRVYSKYSPNAESLMSDLVDICNSIFQRSVLPAEYYTGSTLDLDLSMKKLIVFVQGKGAKVEALKDSVGAEVRVLQESGQRRFSEISVGNYYKKDELVPPVDSTLYGEVVTFDACPKGKYTLDCKGAQKVQVFYEPDVDISVSLVNHDGVEVRATSDGIDAGEYTVKSSIVDAVTKEDVTSHALMGNDISFTTYVKASSDTEAIPYHNGAKILLEPDSQTEFVVEAVYLNDYKITTRDDPNAFPLPLFVRERSRNFSAALTQLEESYRLLEYNNWRPIKAALTVDGETLSEEEMKRVSVKTAHGSTVSFYADVLKDSSAFDLYIGKDESNNMSLPAVGEHAAEVVFTYTDEYGKEYTCTRSIPLNIACDMNVIATVEQNESWYKMGTHDKWKPIKIKIEVDGLPLDEEMLETVVPNIKFDNDITYRCEISPQDSSYYIYLGQDADGDFVKPQIGKYTADISAKYVDENGNEFNDTDTVSFEIQLYSKYWRILKWILLSLLVIALWLIYMLQKVMPKNIIKETARLTTMTAGELDQSFVDVAYRMKGKTLMISASSAVPYDEQCSAIFRLRAVDNRFTRSCRRRVAITDISSGDDRIVIGGSDYINYNGQWIKKDEKRKAERGEPVSAIDQVLNLNQNFRISKEGGTPRLTCNTKTVK